MIDDIRDQVYFLGKKLYGYPPYVMDGGDEEVPVVVFTWDSSENHLKRSVSWNQDTPGLMMVCDGGTGFMFNAFYLEDGRCDAYDVAQVALHILGSPKR